jgi:hypothetical protein
MDSFDPKEMFAWMVDDGGESGVGVICAIGIIPGQTALLQNRSRRVAEMLRPYALAHAQATGRRVFLRRYVAADDLGEA